jgi:hypothetical protein
MSKTIKLLAGCSLLLVLNGCAWVDVKPQGEKVRVLSASEVRRCKPVGRVTSNTVAKIGFIARDSGTVKEELDRLARNHAGSLGGDTVVPAGPQIDGEQSYKVYRCILP